MKKINYLLFTIISMVLFTFTVSAAPSYSLSVSSSTVENGKTVKATISLKNVGAWDVKIVSSGSTNGCNNRWIDQTGVNTNKTFTVTCKASSLGTIAFTISGDITSADGTNIDISGTKTVQVVEPRPASTVNTLKSLSVEGYELSPAFDEETLEYLVEVPSTINSIKINAAKKDSKSSVSGDGEKEVSEGSNRFEIVVKAESGAEKTYAVVVNVKDANPIEVSVDGKNYTVVKNSKNLEIPDGFVEEKTTINGVEVPAFTNEINELTLVALKDESGNIFYYIYKDGNYSKYIQLSSISLNLFPISGDISYKGFEKTTIEIDGNEVEVYKYKNLNNYYLINAMDLSTGKTNIYMYDKNGNTYQIFNEELFKEISKDNELYLYVLCGSLGVIFLCIIIIIIQGRSKTKIIKKIREKEEFLTNDKPKKNKRKEEEI